MQTRNEALEQQGDDVVVNLASDEYFKSQTCLAELKLAEESNKRIIPVVFKDFDRKLNTSNSVAKCAAPAVGSTAAR